MAPHEAVRYNERTASERCNSRLKEDFGARNVMVRGADNVTDAPDLRSPRPICRSVAQSNWLLIVKDRKNEIRGRRAPGLRMKPDKITNTAR
jgi:hypothetical protein